MAAIGWGNHGSEFHGSGAGFLSIGGLTGLFGPGQIKKPEIRLQIAEDGLERKGAFVELQGHLVAAVIGQGGLKAFLV